MPEIIGHLPKAKKKRVSYKKKKWKRAVLRGCLAFERQSDLNSWCVKKLKSKLLAQSLTELDEELALGPKSPQLFVWYSFHGLCCFCIL